MHSALSPKQSLVLVANTAKSSLDVRPVCSNIANGEFSTFIIMLQVYFLHSIQRQ